MNDQKQKKHIDVVTKYFYPIAAGIETNTLETYSVLAKEGFDITVHTSANTYTEKNILPKEEMIRGLLVKRYPTGLFGYKPDIDWQKTNIVALHNFDLFFFRYFAYCLYLKMTGRKQFALIETPHGGFNPEWRVFPKWQAVLKKALHYTLGVWCLNHIADGIRAVSEWEKKEMIAVGVKSEKIEVIDNGLEDEAYSDVDALASQNVKDQVAKIGSYFIQVGRVYPIKNYETTIKALPSLPKNLSYVVVGPIADPAYLEKLKNLAASLGVADRLVFLGVVRGVDKYYLIKHAKAMVHMAIWESFCNVVHEGLSQGVICVVADNTALPLLIKHGINGWTVPTHDSTKVAERMNYIVGNWGSAPLEKIRNYNREIGLQNSWRQVAGRMAVFYDKVYNETFTRVMSERHNEVTHP